MPKLPTEDSISGGPRIIQPGGTASYRVDRPEASRPDTGRAQGLAKLAEAMGQTSDKLAVQMEKDRERKDYLRAEEAFNELRGVQNDLTVGEENGFTRKRGGDAVNQPILEQWTSRFDERAKQIEESLGNDQQRERFRARAGVVRAQFTGNIMEHRAREEDAWAKNVYQTTFDTERNNIGRSPQDEMAVGLSMNRVAVAAEQEATRLGLDPAVAKTKAVDSLWVARLEAWRLKDPVGALAAFQANQKTLSPDVRVRVEEGLFRDAEPVLAAQLKDGMGKPDGSGLKLVGGADLLTMAPEDAAKIKTGNAVVDALPADQRIKVLQAARTLASQQNAQERHGMELRYKDTTAAYERGQDAPNPPTRQDLLRVYGPENGKRLADDLDRAKSFGRDVQRVQNLSASEQIALLNARQPAAGEGYADGIRRWEGLRSAVDRVVKEREQDPARAVLNNAPQVQQAWKTYIDAQANGKDAAGAAQAYAAAALAEQQRLQIQNPQVLPKEMVDSIAKQFAAPPADGQNVSNVMQGMVATWGRYWPMVGKQLGNKIPPEASVIGLGVTPEAEALLAEAAKLKPEVLRQGIPEPEIKDLRERIRTQFEPLRTSVAWQSGGIATYDNYADSAEKVAIALVQKGVKPKDAVDRAFQGLVGFKYEFEDSWRVPKTALGGATSLSALRAGAQASQADITSETPVSGAKVALLVPAAPGAVRPADAEKQWRETVRANGFWATSPGDGGLTLYVRSGLSAQPVLDATGQPVRRTWAELSAVGNSVRAAYFSDVAPRKP